MKETVFSWRHDSRTGEENIEDEPGISCSTRKEGIFKKKKKKIGM